MRYSVAPRGRYWGANIFLFNVSAKIVLIK